MKKIFLILIFTVGAYYSALAQKSAVKSKPGGNASTQAGVTKGKNSTVSTQRSASKGKPRFSLGLETGLPQGNTFSNVYSFIIGGTAKAEFSVAPSLFATISGGYVNLYLSQEVKAAFEAVGLEAKPIGTIPIKGGAKYFFNKNFYGAAELGPVIAIAATSNSSGTGFAFAPGVGASFPVSAKNDIDGGIRYERWSKDGAYRDQISLHLAFKL